MKRLQINRGLLVAFMSFISLLVPLHLAYSMTMYGNMTGYEAFRGYPFDPAFLSTGSFESYSVPVASAYVCPDVGAVPAQPCTVDVDNTWEGARVNLLVAAARANAWTDNGFARALGFAGTAAHGNGWMLVTLRAASAELPPELIANGGKVDVKMTGSAQSTNSADSWHRRVQGIWKLEIGTPGRTALGSGLGSFERRVTKMSIEQVNCLGMVTMLELFVILYFGVGSVTAGAAPLRYRTRRTFSGR